MGAIVLESAARSGRQSTAVPQKPAASRRLQALQMSEGRSHSAGEVLQKLLNFFWFHFKAQVQVQIYESRGNSIRDASARCSARERCSDAAVSASSTSGLLANELSLNGRATHCARLAQHVWNP